MTEQLFNEENIKATIPYFTWEKVGEKVTGVYLGFQLNSNPDKYGKIKKEYVFEQADGTYIKVSGRALPKDGKDGEDFRIIYDMETVPVGTVCGVKYTEDRENGKGNPTKILSAIFPNERTTKPESVAKYQEVYGTSPVVLAEGQDDVMAEAEDEL